MRRTACVLTFRGDAVLAVSRPDPPLRFGLPGGGVDPGETSMQAAARELTEETGYQTPVLEHVYTAKAEDSNRLVSVFFAPLVKGKIRSSHEGVAAWVEPRVVLCGAYPAFTLRMFRQLGLPAPSCRGLVGTLSLQAP